MYVVNVSYGDCDAEPELATVETLGTYKTLDEACEAAADKFNAIMERIDDVDLRCREVKESRYDYYVVYGYYDPELGGVFDEYYYMITVFDI